MGYRSTVAYTIRFDGDDDTKNRQSFYLFLAEAKANVNTSLCFTDVDCFKVDEEKLQIRFYAEGVKWYEGYPDVQCHEELISLSKSWAEDNNFIGGAFARTGEDTTDIIEETWGQGDYDWVGVNRSVYVDWE